MGFFLGACENAQIKKSNGLVEIIGRNNLTDTLTIDPGTTVRFKEAKMFLTGS